MVGDLFWHNAGYAILKYFSLYFWSGTSKAISVISLYLALFCGFLYLDKEGTLTSSAIVSILPTVMSLKKFSQYVAFGCDNYFFLHTVF